VTKRAFLSLTTII